MRGSLLFLLCAGVLCAESLVQQALAEKMAARIRALDASTSGVLGVAAIDLVSGREFAYHGDAVFPTASVIKVPIMIAIFRAAERGDVRLDEAVTLTPAESVGGDGHLQQRLRNGPMRITVRELITAMIRDSDNTAANKCIAIVRRERVNEMLSGFGFQTMRLRRIMMDGASARRGEENTSSPVEMARLMAMLYRGKMANAQSTREMIDIMKLVKAYMRPAIPANVEVASKWGELDGVRCEAGVVVLQGRPFVLSVFSTFLDDGVNPVPDATRIAYEYFDKLSRSNEYGNRLR